MHEKLTKETKAITNLTRNPNQALSKDSIAFVYRKNFLVVDLFFAQLKYEEITQIKAYDIGSFFSKCLLSITNQIEIMF